MHPLVGSVLLRRRRSDALILVAAAPPPHCLVPLQLNFGVRLQRTVRGTALHLVMQGCRLRRHDATSRGPHDGHMRRGQCAGPAPLTASTSRLTRSVAAPRASATVGALTTAITIASHSLGRAPRACADGFASTPGAPRASRREAPSSSIGVHPNTRCSRRARFGSGGCAAAFY